MIELSAATVETTPSAPVIVTCRSRGAERGAVEEVGRTVEISDEKVWVTRAAEKRREDFDHVPLCLCASRWHVDICDSERHPVA
jgi:hypothetical protein